LRPATVVAAAAAAAAAVAAFVAISKGSGCGWADEVPPLLLPGLLLGPVLTV
jgi:hypothetical protein